MATPYYRIVSTRRRFLVTLRLEDSKNVSDLREFKGHGVEPKNIVTLFRDTHGLVSVLLIVLDQFKKIVPRRCVF